MTVATSTLRTKRDFITTKNIQLDEVNAIFDLASHFKQNSRFRTIKNKIIANCFFEPSTRTRLSFESAANRLGCNVIGFSSTEGLSTQKGETLTDTICMIDNYADLIIIRHPAEGSAKLAAEIAACPVINAGDGTNQHPTQALLDLFTIRECQKELNGLSIALVGDLKHGRTIHSLLEVCSLFDIRIYLVSPESLSLSDTHCDVLKERGARFSFHPSLTDVIPKVDILYMTRLQKERGDHLLTLENPFTLTKSMLAKAKSNLKILHPLPRAGEIATEVDITPFAYYFEQAANGVPTRQAILSLLLDEANA